MGVMPVGRAAGGRSPGLTPRLRTRTPAPAAASCSASVRCFAARRLNDFVAPASQPPEALRQVSGLHDSRHHAC